MTERRHANGFKSYVGFDDDSFNTSVEDSFTELFGPHLLSGEMMIADAENVLMFTQVSGRRQGKSGVLYVTNFKLSFVTAKNSEELSYQDTLQLGVYDVCLSNIDSLYLLGDRKKKLTPGKNLVEKVKGLIVVCKNMRMLTFSFKFSPVGQGKTLTNALLHHSFPRRHQLLFAYDYREPYYPLKSETRTFRDPTDWVKELDRTECHTAWRLCPINSQYMMSTSLCPWIVVPRKVADFSVDDTSRQFVGGRLPYWVWGSSDNAACLVRMAEVIPTNHDRTKEDIMLESIRNSHPRRMAPIVVDLSRDLPNIRDINLSYLKFRDLCMPDDLKTFWFQDQHFYTLLDSSKWLYYVSACLSKVGATSKKIRRGYTVVLQEFEDRDLAPLISSLVQLVLDPFFRTISGFQSLVHKEWIAAGHPFCTRLGHLYSDEPNQSPVFLLFLDCVWQLTQQFPTQFQFTETYLTTVWEAALCSIFDTFLFDCERDRYIAKEDRNDPLILRSAWEELQGGREAAFFNNPLYGPNISGTMIKHLDPRWSLPNLQLWRQCYFRHIPILEIINGGPPQIDLQLRLLSFGADRGDEAGAVGGGDNELGLESLSSVGSFFPFSSPWRDDSEHQITPVLLASSLSLNQSFHSAELMCDSASVLNINAPD